MSTAVAEQKLSSSNSGTGVKSEQEQEASAQSSINNNPICERKIITLLKVAYDYEYDYKSRKISIQQGETLELLQKTNQHWWKVIRPPPTTPQQQSSSSSSSSNTKVIKAFFVPAQYVTIVDKIEVDNNISSSSDNNNYSTPSPSNNNSSNNNNYNNSSTKSHSSSGKKSINRNDGARASHRIKSNSNNNSTKLEKNWSSSLEELSRQIVFPGLTSESVIDLSSLTGVHHYNDSVRSTASTSSGSRRFFGGGSSSDRSKTANKPPSTLTKCLSFRNAAYKDDSRNQKDSTKNEGPDSKTETLHNTQSMSAAQSAPIPSPSAVPTRFLDSNWVEYKSETGRSYYYNTASQTSSFKPPRNSCSRRSDESLSKATGLVAASSSISINSTASSSSNANITKSASNNSSDNTIATASSSTTVFSSSPKNPTTTSINPISEREPREQQQHQQKFQQHKKSFENLSSAESVEVLERSKDSSNTSLQHSNEELSTTTESNDSLLSAIPVPEGWEESWDEELSLLCYVHKATGVRWFTSQDPQGKIYYYQENSTESSWTLPSSPTIKCNDESPESLSKSTTSDSLDKEKDEMPTSKSSGSELGCSVKKRHSTGDVVDRTFKSKSLMIHDNRVKIGDVKHPSLPQSKKSIWHESANVLRQAVRKEGQLNRTKMTENGKKVRKNWTTVYAVLTDFHLSLFKDQKTYSTNPPKSELEIELQDANVIGWTEDKSSRKNVFQLSTLGGLQILFQSDDSEKIREWFDEISIVAEEQDSAADISMRLKTESPEAMLDVPVGERKLSSRLLMRSQSNKFKITASTEDLTESKHKIRAHLKKFFHRRPPRESLVKKGIYKDESVFGCSLHKLCEFDKSPIPKFVTACIKAIESRPENLKTDGLYRASGNLSTITTIRYQVDQGKISILDSEEDVHVLAGSLKLFFREMREPLISYDLFEKSLSASTLPPKERLNKFRDIVSHMANPNRETLKALLQHLLKVASNSEFNRMQIPNLAIVFGPTLMWPATETNNMAVDLMQQNRVIEAFLLEYKAIFG